MTQLESFFINTDHCFPVFAVGKAGKTMFSTFVASIMSDKIYVHKRSSTTSIQQLLEMKSIAEEKKQPFLACLDLENFNNQHEILQFTKPKIVVVTNLGDSHLVYKKEISGLSKNVQEFLKALSTETVIVLNKDDDLVSEMEDFLPDHQVIKYGFNTNADFFATSIQQRGHHGVSFKVNNRTEIFLKIYQYTQIYNVLSAITLSRLFNVKLSTIKTQLEANYTVPFGRCNLMNYGTFTIINDTYNHTFQNVTSAAQTLVTFKSYSNKMLMVIGDIENEHSDLKQLHINLGHFLAALPIDVILTFGLYSKFIEEGIHLIPNENRIIIHSNSVDEVVMNLQLFLEPNDTVLLKAAHRSGIMRFLENLDEIFGKKLTPKNM
jgi:UDP-N-acetylmuramoyl-tripeptide--D-alanyl-D-alanine ligase